MPDAFLKLLGERLGLGFGLDRYVAAEPAIRKKVKSRASGNPAQFLAALDRDQKLWQWLIETIVVPESHFFRHPQHFVFLRDDVLPRLAESGRRFRIWSAGCSTGEEPYSIAILLHQMGLAGKAAIYGTDISRNALNKARSGVYGSWSLRGVEDWPGASRYFERHGRGQYRLSRKICDLVSFRELNLAAPLPKEPDDFAHIDVIFCRNVLIYMTAETTAQITSRLTKALAPGGWLIPGPSDPLAGHKSLSSPFVTPSGIFYRRSDGALVSPDVVSALDNPIASPGVSASSPGPAARGSGQTQLRPRGNSPPPFTRRRMPGVPAASRAQTQASRTERTLRDEVDFLVNAGKSDEALKVVNRAVRRDPLSTEAHFLAAFVHWHRMDVDEALSALNKVLYLDPKCAAAHQMRGMILVQNGQAGAARREFWAAYRLAVRLPEHAKGGFLEQETAAQLAHAAQSQIWNLRDSQGAR